MIRSLLAAFAFLICAAAPASAATAVLRGLDKVTGQAHDFQAPVGRAVRFGTLEIVARACQKAPPEATPEVTVYVEVYDNPAPRRGEQAARTEIFHGWMFASSPGLNALEHPVYDIWAIDCRS
ncbi:MAG: DUF2155 domain-containing protein [Hyphomonadaceae bacterium]